MVRDLFNKFVGCGCGCGCGDKLVFGKNSSCDVLWLIILLMIVFKGGAFGLDICTLAILFVVFGKDIICSLSRPRCH